MNNAEPYELGKWRVDPGACQLDDGSSIVRIEPRAMAVLNYLATHSGRTVSRNELFDKVWETRYVVDEALTKCISQLRSGLQDDARRPSYILTIAKLGYRLLVAPVSLGTVPAHVVTHGTQSGSRARAGAVELCRRGRDHYLRGRYYWGIRSSAAVSKAIDHFEAACRIDPGYALAHSGAAVCWGFRSLYSGLPPSQTFPIAKAAAERALGLDDAVSEAHSTLGICLAMFAHDWSAAEQALRRAIELDPNSSVAHHWYALFLGFLGRLDEALREAEVAVQLDPLSPAIRMNYAMIHQLCGRDSLTIDICEGILAQHAHHHLCRIMLGHGLCKVGRFDEGIAHLQTAHEHSGRQLDGLAHRGLGYAIAGRPELARQMLAGIRNGNGPVSSLYVARIYVALGELDAAFEYLERAYHERSILLMAITVDPWFVAVRGDARFLEFTSRLKIPSQGRSGILRAQALNTQRGALRI